MKDSRANPYKKLAIKLSSEKSLECILKVPLSKAILKLARKSAMNPSLCLHCGKSLLWLESATLMYLLFNATSGSLRMIRVTATYEPY